MAKRIGYARVAVVSEAGLNEQAAALKTEGCEAVFTDEGKSPAEGLRPGLQRALAALSPGDTLVVRDVSRLSRDLHELAGIRTLLSERDIQLDTIEAPEPSEVCGRFMFATSEN